MKSARAPLPHGLDATMPDAAFRVDADKMRLHLGSHRGPGLQAMLDEAYVMLAEVEGGQFADGRPAE